MSETAFPAAPGPSGGFEMIELPNPLAAKAAVFRAGNIDHDYVDAGIAGLVRNYPEAVAEQRIALRHAWNRIRTGNGSDEDRRQFGAITHDFKGQAASFGYPLLGRVAATLSLLSKLGALGNTKVQPVIEAHVSAIEQILQARIEGDGGEAGRNIVDSLRQGAQQSSG